MEPGRIDQLRRSHLRFVYSGKVVSFDLTSNITYGEIARTLAESSRQRYSFPVAIDVTVMRPDTSFT